MITALEITYLSGRVTLGALGAKIRVGTCVRVVQAIDRDIHDVSKHIGRRGVVMRRRSIEAEPGPDYIPPEQDMRPVRFKNGDVQVFWPEELQVIGGAS